MMHILSRYPVWLLMKSVRTTVSLSKEQYESLCHLAEVSDLSISRVIRQAVGEFLSRHEGSRLDPISTETPSVMKEEQK
ncbi:MAG: ribbon-helix-helix protein, CopG family [Gammaproteobacteria bacterium]|nr:ribbon-helix-helix protein, CopG family [Gammaproteobacteria bacterium]